MRKIFKSDFVECEESGKQITVFALDSFEEYCKLDEMSHDEMCALMDVTDESKYPYAIPFGVQYSSYSFDLIDNFFIMIERVALNV